MYGLGSIWKESITGCTINSLSSTRNSTYHYSSSGVDKKAIALNMVHDGIEVHNAINKEHPIDSSTVVDAVGNGIDATITTIKAVEKAKAGLPTVQ